MESKTVDQIFWAAAQIASAAERESYLQDACGDDAALRRRVEQLLEVRTKASALFESPVAPELFDHASAGDADLRNRVLELLKSHHLSQEPFDVSPPGLQAP